MKICVAFPRNSTNNDEKSVYVRIYLCRYWWCAVVAVTVDLKLEKGKKANIAMHKTLKSHLKLA